MFNKKDMMEFALFYKGVLDERIPLPVDGWNKVNKDISSALDYWLNKFHTPIEQKRISEIIDGLKYHNEWRRGAEIKQMSPKDIGEIIDGAISLLEQSDKNNSVKSLCDTCYCKCKSNEIITNCEIYTDR